MKDKPTLTIGIALLLAFAGSLYAQSLPVSDTLRANSIQAGVKSNGAFFLDGAKGQFLVPATTGAASSISLLKAAGLWLGGRDSAGNLSLSAQLYNENGKTDFYPGILTENGLPYNDFNLIADVTQAEINAHIANPAGMIPSIYGWPGRGNSFFANYHGFDLPGGFSQYAAFHDVSFDDNYNPADGDYPVLGMRGCPLNYTAEEDMWFAFHDAGPHTQSGGAPLDMEVQTQFFGLKCPEGSPVDRVVFVVYKLINRHPVPLDSSYFGVFMDVEIGNGGDDFIGCDTARRVVFAYNGDATDEGGFENTPPVLAVDLLRGPFDPDDPFGQEVKEWHFVPVDDNALNSPEAYYNLLAGRHPDGTPFPNKGLMYAGNPLDPAAWSELSADNAPGERKALASFGPFRLLPGAVNEIVLGYAWVRRDTDGNVFDNLSLVGATMDAVQDVFDGCFYLWNGCPGNVSAREPVSPLDIRVMPNPFTDLIRVESDETPLESVFLYDATGRLLRQQNIGGGAFAALQTGNLPAGLYVLQVRTEDGRSGAFKLVRE